MAVQASRAGFRCRISRVLPTAASAEQFTDEERRRLAPYFTNLDSHIFALTNLPETVKGALFARYSRSAKSLRRLFLDEFHKDVEWRVFRSECSDHELRVTCDAVQHVKKDRPHRDP